MPDFQPTREDEQFMRQVHDDVRRHPDLYSDAGEWLDSKYSAEECWAREKPRPHQYRRKRKIAASPLSRICAAISSLVRSKSTAPLVKPTGWSEAAKYLLLLWLLTDEDAHTYEPTLCELQLWPWDTEAHGSFSRLWSQAAVGGCSWPAWLDLCRRAWDARPYIELKKEVDNYTLMLSNSSNPADTCDREWLDSIQALDAAALDSQEVAAWHQGLSKCNIAPEQLKIGRSLVAFGTPAWPAEWGLLQCHMSLPLIHLARSDVALPVTQQLLAESLVALMAKTRAALQRMPQRDNNPWPRPPAEWPRTTGKNLFGYGDASCFATIISFLQAIEQALTLRGGHLFSFEEKTGRPHIKTGIDNWKDRRLAEWTRHSLQNLDEAVFSRTSGVTEVQSRITGYLPELENECIKWRKAAEAKAPPTETTSSEYSLSVTAVATRLVQELELISIRMDMKRAAEIVSADARLGKLASNGQKGKGKRLFRESDALAWITKTRDRLSAKTDRRL